MLPTRCKVYGASRGEIYEAHGTAAATIADDICYGFLTIYKADIT